MAYLVRKLSFRGFRETGPWTFHSVFSIGELDLKSGGPWFKSSTLPLDEVECFSVAPSSAPQPQCVKSQLVNVPLVGILNHLCSARNICVIINSFLGPIRTTLLKSS